MNTPNPKPHLRIAVDIGGTFTDMAAFDESSGKLLFGKALSTHGELVRGIQSTIASADIDWQDGNLFLHGSTIAINTLLERNGAHTALLITEGFRDIYEIGRVNRPDAYNLFFNKHQPLVKRSLRFEVADLCSWEPENGEGFDFILVNSLLHHMDTASVHRLLGQLSRLLTKDGHIQIVDLVLPQHLSISRALALADRGDFPRPLEEWRGIFEQHFRPVVFEPFAGSGTTLIAGERTGRVVRGVELAPAYVDLAIARWRMLYPDQPVTLVGDGRDFDAVAAAREGALSDAA